MISFLRKLGWLFRRRSREQQLADELRFHLEEDAVERHEAGVTEEEAQWAAKRELGNLSLVGEDTRAAWTWTFLEQALQDLRYGSRTILRNPAFATLAALSLALGIGANTALYSFMDALLLRTLPVPDPESLVILKWHVTGRKSVGDSVVHDVSGQISDDPTTGKTAAIFPYPAFQALRESPVFSVLFAYRPARKLNVMIRGQAEVAGGEYVSGAYFAGVGTVPWAGRLIEADDDRTGAPPVVVLSHAFAARRFADPSGAVGQPVFINSVPFTVIGVAQPDFFGVDPAMAPDFFLPVHADHLVSPGRNADRRYSDEHYYWLEMMGRLRPGVTIAQAHAVLSPAFDRWAAATATNQEERANLPEFMLQNGSGGLDNLRRRYSQPVFLLLAMVGLILAIACANIANLLLARTMARKREMAVRLSMGAGRWRVVRQLLTESLLLASIGGALGVLFSVWGSRLLKLLLESADSGFPLRVDLNWRVLAAAAALTMITGLLFGLAPALQSMQVDVAPELKQTRTGERRHGSLLRFSLSRALVVAQMAISLVLLVAAGLFARALANLQSIETGFRRDNVLVFKVNAQQAGHRAPEIVTFYEHLQERFAALPGVRSASMANSPLIGDGAWGWPVVPAGSQEPAKAPSGHGSGMADTATRVLATAPGFFATMQIPLLAGREFDERDRLGAPPVAIVNEAWLKVNLEGRNPIGQRVVSFRPGLKPSEMEIVGVARNARYEELTGKFPAIVYVPFRQDRTLPIDEMTFFLCTERDPLAYADTVREIVHQADARIPVTNLGTQDSRIEREMGTQILFARLCSGFAILALVIASVGLYGTMSYTVARRTSEIGIRIALGAQQRAVVWMVLREVLFQAALGLAISVPAAIGMAKSIESLLFRVRPNDPQALTAAVAILLAAVLAAAWVPARRASRIDPITAVRHD